jgi:YVTN family beta-propeller protein
MRTLLCAACVGTVLAGLTPGRPPNQPARSGLRRPVALALADSGRWLFVGNRNGSIAVIDTAAARVVEGLRVGRTVADLVATPDGTHLLAVDEEAGELVVLRRSGAGLKMARRLAIGPGPVGVAVAGPQASVVSLWPRRLTIIDLSAPAEPRVVSTVSLPFAPRLQLPIGDGRVVVADAFGGGLAVVDLVRGAVESARTLPGHNIRGLALTADGAAILVSHQGLNRLATSGRDDIHWGNFVTNDVRELSLAAVLDPKADLLADSRLHPLGEVGHGGGDPAGVAVSGGRVVVALAGAGEVAVGKPGDEWRRLTVGRRPTAVAVSPNGKRAFVANTHADSVSVVDLEARRVTAEIALGPAVELTAADRGELLFHDARLSHDRWMSCHSCHTDGHTNGRLADTLGDGTYGTPKRVPSLLGVADTGPWAWTGGVNDLRDQMRQSVATTMRGTKLSDDQADDLVAYLRSLAPAPPLGRFRDAADRTTVARGRELFDRHGCGTCHAPPTYTTPRTHDVGLVDESGQRAFNAPSLRGVSQAGPYFHDGRAATLADVFVRHRHQLRGDLAAAELADLLAFLESL